MWIRGRVMLVLGGRGRDIKNYGYGAGARIWIGIGC